jgi:hypothetical protein
MEDMGNNLAWIFFGTTAFVVLSLIYEGIRWGYQRLSKKKTQNENQETEV